MIKHKPSSSNKLSLNQHRLNRLIIYSAITAILMAYNYTPSANGDSLPASDDALVSGDWIYKPGRSNTNEVTIIGHKNPSGDLVFPSEIDGRPVTGVSYPMFKENGANVTSVKIPDSVTWIDCATFGGLPALTNVSIGKGVKSLGSGVFVGSLALEKLEVSKENPHYSTENGVLFNKDKTVLFVCPNGKKGKYIIPNTVKTIRNMAFTGGQLTELIIPEGVTHIEGAAFMAGVENLEKLSIPTTLQEESELKRVGLDSYNIRDLLATGALKTKNNTVRYRKPENVNHVQLRGSFDNWENGYDLVDSESDPNVAVLDIKSLNLPQGRYEYKFLTNGEFEDGDNRIISIDDQGNVTKN